MGTVLMVLGIIFVIIAVVVVLAFLLMRRTLKAILKSLTDAGVPTDIHLSEELNPTWLNEPHVETTIKELNLLGFTRGRAYGIDEMPQVRLLSFFRADPATVCVLYEHDEAGNWVDLTVIYEDGSGITVTNAPTGEDVDTRPKSTKVFLKEANLAALSREIERRVEPKQIRAVNDGNFKQTFEDAYREEMEWRNKRGGVTEEEVRRIAEKEDGEYSDLDIAEAMILIKSGELFRLHEDCIEHFLRQNPGMFGEDENGSECLFVVSDQLDVAGYVGYLGNYLDLPDELYERLERLSKVTNSPKVLFTRANAELPARLRATKMGSVSSPIDADIYSAVTEL